MIHLNLQILEKLEELETKQKFEKELDKLSEQLINLSLGKPVEAVNKTPELYKFWIPRK